MLRDLNRVIRAVKASEGEDDSALDTVRTLLQKHPDMAKTEMEENINRVLLHLCAICNTIDLRMVEVVLQAWPEATLAQDDVGNTPLHLAASLLEDDDHGVAVVEMLLKANAAAATTLNNLRRTPLHGAVQHRGEKGAALVDVLLKYAPEAALIQDAEGAAPLHIAVCFQRGPNAVSVVEALLKCKPQAALLKDTQHGRNALRLAADSSHEDGTDIVEPEVVELLLKAQPAAALEKDDSGDTPLHVAVGYQTGAEGANTVNLILQYQPEAALITDAVGWTPLHVAAVSKGGSEGTAVVEALLRVAPATLQQKAHDGATPLDIALSRTKAKRSEEEYLPKSDPLIALLKRHSAGSK